ncbi:MAG: glycerol-3-phosphate acyltransferase [Actinobacteria bacterium]|nr:glycerol-3-phosphate acyltransferase [Actinomycetota bacterium]
MNWAVLWVAPVAYLVGSFPTAYVVARQRTGVDIRTVGSGNVGGSNMRALQGTWATVFVGVIDIFKGLLPVWLTVRLGLGAHAMYVAAVAVVVGHDWSVWLGLQGGRGGASSLGTLLVLYPYGFLWIVGFLTIGKITQTVAILHLCGAAALPLVAWLLGQSGGLLATLIVLALLMVVKRLEANQCFRVPADREGGAPHGLHVGTTKKVYLNRLFLDRDYREISNS